MTDQMTIQQSGTTKSYNPHDHLIKIKSKDGTLKDYYPAGWRLYELNMRYENHSFSSEIVHMDVERNFVVVKCVLYLGGDPTMSPRKTEAMKSGLLSQLDKVETAAKARCARDFGISTEFALLDDDDLDSVEVVHSDEQSNGQADDSHKQSNGHKPARTPATVQAFFAKTYKVAPTDLDTRWQAFKKHVLGETVADDGLTEEQLNQLNGYISRDWQERQSQRSIRKVS
jgi:hypothetical protein